MNRSAFQRYILPGLVFQSVVVAGGYGTGREVVEFFLTLGPARGLAAMAVSTIIWSVVCAVSYEFARAFKAYDYKSFFGELIGRLGWVYEVTWFGFMLIVMAVIAAASGQILEDVFSLNYWTGVIGVGVLIGALVYWGTEGIERVLTGWTFVLYSIFGALFIWSVLTFGPDIKGALTREVTAGDGSSGNWLIGGVAYAGYNLAVIPALLFSVRHVSKRREAVIAGLLAGPIAMIPALFLFIAMIGLYPAILPSSVPAITLLEALGSRWFLVLFQVMLLGTLVETGTGLIHSVNERVAAAIRSRSSGSAVASSNDTPDYLSRGKRLAIALVWLSAAAFVARFGLIDLIAKGYGTLTWLFIAIYVVPILTIGVWRLSRKSHS